MRYSTDYHASGRTCDQEVWPPEYTNQEQRRRRTGTTLYHLTSDMREQTMKET